MQNNKVNTELREILVKASAGFLSNDQEVVKRRIVEFLLEMLYEIRNDTKVDNNDFFGVIEVINLFAVKIAEGNTSAAADGLVEYLESCGLVGYDTFLQTIVIAFGNRCQGSNLTTLGMDHFIPCIAALLELRKSFHLYEDLESKQAA